MKCLHYVNIKLYLLIMIILFRPIDYFFYTHYSSLFLISLFIISILILYRIYGYLPKNTTAWPVAWTLPHMLQRITVLILKKQNYFIWSKHLVEIVLHKIYINVLQVITADKTFITWRKVSFHVCKSSSDNCYQCQLKFQFCRTERSNSTSLSEPYRSHLGVIWTKNYTVSNTNEIKF